MTGFPAGISEEPIYATQTDAVGATYQVQVGKRLVLKPEPPIKPMIGMAPCEACAGSYRYPWEAAHPHKGKAP